MNVLARFEGLLRVCDAFLTQIDLDNRKRGDEHNDCMLNVDGTDFEAMIKGTKFYSHKFNGSALRYEVATSIKQGDICWINGPYPAGAWNDISIFRDGLMQSLDMGERVEADDGYIAESPLYIKCPSSVANPARRRKLQSRVRSRHETVNARFKQWGALRQRFRHAPGKHGDVFYAVATITQLSIENGMPLFHVEYTDE